MKNYRLLILAVLFISNSLLAQVPQLLNYQSVVRNAQGTVMPKNTVVKLQFIIHDGSISGTSLFTETSSLLVIDNDFGLVTTAIGTNTSLAGLNWGTGTKWLQVKLDAGNTGTFTDMGTTQLITVPYALYALHSGDAGSSGAGVGFSASGSAAGIVAASSGNSTRIFTTVDFNDGSGYSSSTGAFTAPAAGLYHFDAAEAVQAQTGYSSGFVSLVIKQNGTIVHGGVSEMIPPATAGSYAVIQNSVDVKLSAGDVITVIFENRTNVDFNLTGLSNFNKFAGYKVY